MKDFKFIFAIIITFVVVMATTLLLEIQIFKHWLRQAIVVLFVVVELYLGFVVSKYIKEN